MKPELLQIVNNIPVDQTAKATPTVKNFLLEQLRNIQRHRDIIHKAAIDKKQEEVMDAYRKSVHFQDKVDLIEKLTKDLEAASRSLLEVGLTQDGELIGLAVRRYGAVKRYEHCTNSEWITIPDETVKKIQKAQELIKAVKGATEVYTTYNQLETRMMMASTVGEMMAIVNAVADEEVFKLQPERLGLPAPKKQNKANKKGN